ncbi:MAG: hypothetical protein AABZ74_09600 [Cyanobacteriota bacterium]
MAYSKFTLKDLKEKFNVNSKQLELFKDIKSIEKSDFLTSLLDRNLKMPLRTEKAKSELVLSPILLELSIINNYFFKIYSGENLDVDKKAGLYGECDFLITKNEDSYDFNLPIISVVEAKMDNIDKGIAQCSAQMVGINFFNQKNDTKLNIIYGCVTTVDEWKFLKLENNTIYIDKKTYYFNELEKVLGVFQYIIDFYKKQFSEN